MRLPLTAAPAPVTTAPRETPDTPEAAFAPGWQRTLFLMMGVQMGMNVGFTVLSPVMPLFLPELGRAGRRRKSISGPAMHGGGDAPGRCRSRRRCGGGLRTGGDAS